YGDDGDHHQQFDQSESASSNGSHARPPSVEKVSRGAGNKEVGRSPPTRLPVGRSVAGGRPAAAEGFRSASRESTKGGPWLHFGAGLAFPFDCMYSRIAS